MDYLVQTTGQAETELTEALAGEIFYNPLTDCWENKGKFLAGNVVEKCKEICTVLADLTGNAQKWAATSVEALGDATPELIPYEELDFNMGERWIPASIYASFAKNLFGVNTTVMYFDVNDTYIVSLQGHSPIAYNVYSIGSYNGEALFVHALHDTVPEITKEIMRNGESIRVPDEEAKRHPRRYRRYAASSTNGWITNLSPCVMNWYACITNALIATSVLIMTVRHRHSPTSLLSSSHTTTSIPHKRMQSG